MTAISSTQHGIGMNVYIVVGVGEDTHLGANIFSFSQSLKCLASDSGWGGQVEGTLNYKRSYRIFAHTVKNVSLPRCPLIGLKRS